MNGVLLRVTANPWGNNPRGGAPVAGRLRGARRTGVATAMTDGPAASVIRVHLDRPGPTRPEGGRAEDGGDGTVANDGGDDARRRNRIATTRRRGRLILLVGTVLILAAGILLAARNEAWRPLVLFGGLAVAAGLVLLRFPA